jgi:cysteinyl-tRNA synthetase, unknown class
VEAAMRDSISIWQRIKAWFGLEAEPTPPPASYRRRLPRQRKVARPGFKPSFTQYESTGLPIKPVRLTGCETWVYKLQGNTVQQVAASDADVFVMDPHSDGMASVFTPADVIRMRQRPGIATPQKLLAYMSIGEAEKNRFYWQPGWVRENGGRVSIAKDAPAWLDSQNGEGWDDNFKVKYWDPEWQKLITGEGMFLDRITAAGFDGVYLDIIDGFQFFERRDDRKTGQAEMITFVQRICRAARAKRADFLIVPQNGEELMQHDEYRDAISAIGKEDVLFNQKEGLSINTRCFVVRQSAKDIRDVAADLGRGLKDGIPVLSVEYLRDDASNRMLIPDAEREMRALGYMPYFADRLLRKIHPAATRPSSVPVS